MHGLSVHFKLYPLIYSITYLVALAPPSTRHSLRATLRSATHVYHRLLRVAGQMGGVVRLQIRRHP